MVVLNLILFLVIILFLLKLIIYNKWKNVGFIILYFEEIILVVKL